MVGQPITPRARPLRVLNLIDSLSGGGSERLLWETVRLSDPARVQHLVVTTSPDWFGDFHYADRLREVGTYAGEATTARNPNFIGQGLSNLRDFARKPSPGNISADVLRFTIQMAALIVTFPRTVIAVVRSKPDVVHSHTFYGFVHSVFIGMFSRIPVVHTVPSLFVQMRGAGFSWLPKFYRWSRLGVDTYFTGASVAELRSVGIPREQIVPVAGGLDLVSVQAARAERSSRRAATRLRLGLPVDAILALNIGRLHESKGQAHAIMALARLRPEFPHLHLLVLGEGKLREELTALAHSLGVSDRVHLAGFWKEPLDGCAAADLYLRTNLFEGDNLSSLLAVSLGLPTAGFATGREIDIVRSAGAGILVTVSDTAALAVAARTLLLREDRGEALGQLGATYIDAHLGFDSLLHAYESAYHRVVAEPAHVTKRVRNILGWTLKIFLTAGIMTIVFTRVVHWETLVQASRSFPARALAILLVLHVAQRWIIAWQTRLALMQAGVKLRTSRIFHIHLITSFFSVVLPGQIAGAAVSWHLFSRDSGRRAQTAAALIYLRLIGFFMLVVITTAGLVAEPRLLALHAQWIVLSAGVLIGLPLLCFHSPLLARTLKKISDVGLGKLPWPSVKSALANFWTSLNEFTAMPLGTQVRVWFAAVVTYFINVSAGLVAMHAAQVPAPDSAIVWLLAVVNLVSLIPFTLVGFGVRELGIAALLKQWYNVPTETAVLLSLALGAVSLVASAGLGGAAALLEIWLNRRRKISNA